MLGTAMGEVRMSGYAVIPNCPVATCSPPYVTRFNLVVMYVMRKRLHKAQATDRYHAQHGSDGP